MLFSSTVFLYWFLPAMVAVYFVVPMRAKNAVLLFASLVFYAWGEPRYALLMLLSITQGYFFARLIGKNRGTRSAKVYLIVSLIISLGLLGYYKYANFFVESFNAVLGTHFSALNIALPIGISFYTFQLISYVADVYRGDVEPQRSYIAFAAYIAMFPQLIAGPIVRYSDIELQLKERTHSIDNAAYGARRFVTGLAKKVLIANVLAELVSAFKSSGEKSVLFYWVYAAAYMLHVYFDFSGYSDMAIGLGALFGFTFPENFNYPYTAASITEFWRRWHMSLSSWFKDYVYIPLGGSRVKKSRAILNIAIVWMLTGLWHGADWNFVMWGIMFAVLLIIEKQILLPIINAHRATGHIYTLLCAMLCFIMFDASSVKEGFATMAGLFGAGVEAVSSAEAVYYLKSYALPLIIAAFGATPLPRRIKERIENTRTGGIVMSFTEPVILALLLIVCTAYLVDGSFNPFLYFRF